ncbi:MAG: copper resistance protein NlpE N-terminal domain-containing protein [Candidatus Andersenbacteria bacterium]|nr:copper resistance protein NlpE N-terminal domain-containing protein [Candidatus Andersenbacteria bacterium]
MQLKDILLTAAWLIVLVGLAGGLLYWRLKSPANPNGTITIVTPEPAVPGGVAAVASVLPTIDPALSRTFSGTLPCASCEGIQTELTLTQAGPFVAEGTYRLKELYLGEKDGLFESTGLWTTLRGSATDENATVFQLNPNKPADARYYLKVSEAEIKLLDKEIKEIDSSLNYSLKTQTLGTPTPTPSPSPTPTP